MKILFVASLILLTTACQTQSYSMSAGSTVKPSTEIMQSFFVSGIGQTKEINAAEICGGADKVIKVESHMSFLNGFLGVITLGIYTPRQARVYCQG